MAVHSAFVAMSIKDPRTKVLHLKPISRRVYALRSKISCFRSLRSSCEARTATLSFDVPSSLGSMFVGSICACDVQLNSKSEPFHFIDVIPDSDLTVTRRCWNYYFWKIRFYFHRNVSKSAWLQLKKISSLEKKSQATKSLSFPLKMNFFHETKRC